MLSTFLHALLISAGILSALAVVAGITRIVLLSRVTIVRGPSRKEQVLRDMGLVLSFLSPLAIPALTIALCVDLLGRGVLPVMLGMLVGACLFGLIFMEFFRRDMKLGDVHRKRDRTRRARHFEKEKSIHIGL